MARSCTVCRHEARAEIDHALIRGTPARQLASRFVPLTRMALWRHREDHLPAALAKAQEASEVARGDELLRELQALKAKAVTLLLAAEQAGDWKAALAGVREARSCIETLLEVAGELDRRSTTDLATGVATHTCC